MVVGCLLAQGFDDVAYRLPRERLESAGVEVRVVGMKRGARLLGRLGDERAFVDSGIDEVHPGDFAAIYIPGGQSPDKLRAHPKVVTLVRDLFRMGKPIGAIGHGSQLLLSAGLVQGRRLTASRTVRVDLEAAGAWVMNREVVVDGNLITSRTSDDHDIDAFSLALLSALGLSAGVQDVISVQPSG